MIPGFEGDNNQDSVKGRRGRSLRDFVYVVSTPQRFGALSWFDLIRDPKAWVYLAVAKVVGIFGAPVALVAIFLIPAFWRFGVRAWFFWPMTWQEGHRHVFVLYTANGYWHRAEYIHGRGEVVEVLTDSHGAVPASTGYAVLNKTIRVMWGDGATEDNPRDMVRTVKTYRRRPVWYQPLMFYSRTSVGFASHMLGIRSPMIRTPKDLLDYCERESVQEERTAPHIEHAA